MTHWMQGDELWQVHTHIGKEVATVHSVDKRTMLSICASMINVHGQSVLQPVKTQHDTLHSTPTHMHPSL